MRNIGEENFNEDELERLSVKITGGAGMAQINAKVDDMGATLNLLSMYTGLSEVVTVASTGDMTDQSKTYRVGDKYYRYNGTAWVEDTNIVTAAITLAAINGQSAIKIKADKIDFVGFTTFVRPSDLGASGTTSIDGGRITTGTLYADALAKASGVGGYNYVAFGSGLDFRNPAYFNFQASTYRPAQRHVVGLHSLSFYGDTKLNPSTGAGVAGNGPSPQQGYLMIGQTINPSTGVVTQDSFDIGGRTNVMIIGQGNGYVSGAGNGVRIGSVWRGASLASTPAGTVAFELQITNGGIIAYKMTRQADGQWVITQSNWILAP
jgi:hypothetical protein